MTINERVKLIRKELGLNQTEFGQRIAIAQGYLTNIESGKREVTEKILKLICLEFNVNEDWLRTGEGEMFITLDREDELAIWSGKLLNPNNDNEFMRKFVHMLSKLEADDWKLIEKMMLLMQEENKKD